MSYLSSDVMGINAAILNGVNIGIKLYPNKEAFRLMSFPPGVEGECEIRNITLQVTKVKMTPQVILAHNQLLAEVNDATYPFIRTEVRSFSVPAGMRTATIENPYQSNIPARLLIGMVKSDAKAGHFQKNPLLFQHFNIVMSGTFSGIVLFSWQNGRRQRYWTYLR